jgi:hypothetical protein
MCSVDHFLEYMGIEANVSFDSPGTYNYQLHSIFFIFLY